MDLIFVRILRTWTVFVICIMFWIFVSICGPIIDQTFILIIFSFRAHVLYQLSHKKRNGGFSVVFDLKVPYLFTFPNQATPTEESDTKIIKFDWVILILWPFVKTQSFSNFAWFLRPMSEGLCWEWPFDPCQQKQHGSTGFHKAL